MTAEDSKAIARRYFEEFHNQRRDELIGEIIAPGLVEPTRRATEQVRTAFPDFQITIEDQVAEEDKVATVWTGRGAHQGDWSSPIGVIPATGKTVTWTGTTTLRIADGQIAEVIGSNWDHLGILQQLDAVVMMERRSGA